MLLVEPAVTSRVSPALAVELKLSTPIVIGPASSLEWSSSNLTVALLGRSNIVIEQELSIVELIGEYELVRTPCSSLYSALAGIFGLPPQVATVILYYSYNNNNNNNNNSNK